MIVENVNLNILLSFAIALTFYYPIIKKDEIWSKY